jgi:hypothetical protein
MTDGLCFIAGCSALRRVASVAGRGFLVVEDTRPPARRRTRHSDRANGRELIEEGIQTADVTAEADGAQMHEDGERRNATTQRNACTCRF